MKLKVVLAALIIAPLALTACSKQENAPASEQVSVSGATAPTESGTISAEQKAAIDALDQPVLDEKNTDIPTEKANVPADVATHATEDEAPKTQ